MTEEKRREETEEKRRDRREEKTERTECPTMAAKLPAYAIVLDKG